VKRRMAAGACCLAFALAASGCESEAYDVRADVSYDSTIGYYGTFDLYEPEADSGRAKRRSTARGRR
jgi:hypothetical protein